MSQTKKPPVKQIKIISINKIDKKFISLTTILFFISILSVGESQCSFNCNNCTVDNLTCLACDTGYYVDASSACTPCNSSSFGSYCTTCNSTHCSSCLNTSYVLNYSSTIHVCVLCSIYRCKTCSAGPQCSECVDGYFLNSSVSICMPCHFPCLTCNTTGTTCLTCNTTNLQYYLENTTSTCKFCYHIIPNCTQCSQNGTICYNCTKDLFYLDANDTVCTPCPTQCSKCINSTYCLSCINFTYAYNSTTHMCDLCNVSMPKCTQCITSSVCLACDNTNGTYYLTYPPNTCVLCDVYHPHCLTCNQTVSAGPACLACQIKYFVDNRTSCTACQPECLNCTSSLVCTACVSAQYALNGNVCTLCSTFLTNCLLCNGTATCLNCTNFTVTNSGTTCVNCSSTQYPDSDVQICYACVPPCETCLSRVSCLTCLPYYQYVPASKSCKDICGDTVIISYPCDNGIGILNDGCSDKCAIQANFTCNIYLAVLANGTSVNQSICSYNLNVSLTLISIYKQPFTNQLTWTYSVKPYLFGLPGTYSRIYNFTQLKNIFVLYNAFYGPVYSSYIPVGLGSLSGLTILSIQYDPSSSRVAIKIAYQNQIKYENFQFLVNFTYLKSVLSIPYFNTTQDTAHQTLLSSYLYDSLIGRYYTEQQYSQAKLIYYGGLIVSIFSFIAFLVGIFSKDLVGLEMAMLCQFAYISLFYYKGTLQLPLYALKSLLYSTGFNAPWAEIFYQISPADPPQARPLEFDSITLCNNFNIMTIIYIIPLIAMIPFIPLKAKCIRKLSYIQMGHKWVDLLMGQVLLSAVLFNYQYFLLNVIIYYRDSRNIANYSSTMIIWIGGLASLGSFLGIFFKPQIYGNFRTAFRYNMELRREVIQQKSKKFIGEENLITKFQSKQRCNCLKACHLAFCLFINENYFWRNWRSVHLLMTLNHYNILIFYFTFVTIALTLFSSSELIIVGLSLLIFIELILFRPYGKISQKLRAIYFFFVYAAIASIRYMNNFEFKGQNSVMLACLILLLLGVALLWTYIELIYYFVNLLRHQLSNRNIVVSKVFNNDVENQLDKEAVAEEEQALMRKLMKRYERIQLQYNLNDARNQLITAYTSNNDSSRNLIAQNSQQIQLAQLNRIKSAPEQQAISINKQSANKQQPNNNPDNKKISPSKIQKLVKAAQETKNYKKLKQELEKQKKKKKKKQMKNKVTGQKMLKLLNLDNFKKYQEEFLMDDDEKRKLDLEKRIKEEMLESQKKQQEIQKQEELMKYNTLTGQEGQQIDLLEQLKMNKKQQQGESQLSQQQKESKDDYQSVQPKNLEQAQAKIQQEQILTQQNTHIRYKRAVKLITNQGLQLDKNLIVDNYKYI